MLTIATGASVANLYYNQPLLSDIAELVAGGWRDEGIVFCTAQ